MSTVDTTLRVELRVTLERAYHVGAGHGRGTSLDSALFTERVDGVEIPAVRYAHGILRQAVFDLLQAPPLHGWRRCPASGKPRPDGEGGAPYCTRQEVPCPVCRIFGSAAWPSPWSFSTMRPAENAPPPVEGRRSYVVSRASVDARTRRAGDGTLFSEELGAPLTFAFTAACAGEDREEALDALALLVAAARAVSGVGADRRRGRGECAIRLHPRPGDDPELSEEALLKRFARAWLARDPAAATAPIGRIGTFAAEDAEKAASIAWTRHGDSGASSGRIAARLVVRLEEPLAAGTRPLAGNLLESERFVPGTLLLGALAERALRSRRASEAAFLRAFRDGGALFPDLLPAMERGGSYRPTLPAPHDLFTCGIHPGPAAHQGHGFWSAVLADTGDPPAAAGDPVEAVRCPACREELREMPPEKRREEAARRQVKARRVKHFVVAGAGEAYQVSPVMREETKVQVDPATGRVAGASLYHRELIAAGTLLAGTLHAESGVLADLAAWGALGEEGAAVELHLGKRSGRGYGRATLVWTRVEEGEAEAARERTRGRVQALLDVGRSVPILLASRLLARDALGRAHRSLSPAVLGLEGGGRCAVEWGVTGGFWRHIGLPRRQEAALLAGSVLHWEPPAGAGASWAERLAALEHGAPLGERVAEGFGRVAVAPFPYEWVDGGAPAGEVIPLPRALRRDGAPAPGGRGLRDDPLAERRKEWEAHLESAREAFARDEWRAVARLLYVRAGDSKDELVRALTRGGGGPHAELERVAAGLDGRPPAVGGKEEPRAGKSFLDGDGKRGWDALAPLLKEAAGSEVSSVERAPRTRALADALAAIVTPGKGAEG